MVTFCKLQYLDSTTFIAEIKPFLAALLENREHLEKLIVPLKTSGVTYRIFLSAVKLYKAMMLKKDKYLINYEVNKTKSTLEYYDHKKYKMIDTRIPRGHTHQSIFNKFEQTAKDYVMYEKAVIREIYNDEYLLILGCFVVASKMYNDVAYTNESWEPVAKIDFKRINLVEKIILEVLEYNVFFAGELAVQNEIAALLDVSVKKRRGMLKRIFCVK